MLRRFLVFSNRGLRVDFLNDIKHDRNGNQKRSAADGECLDTGESLDDNRHDCNHTQEKCAEKRDPRDNVTQILCSIHARTHTWNEGAIFLKIFCNLIWFKCDCRIEIRKYYNKKKIKCAINPIITKCYFINRKS